MPRSKVTIAGAGATGGSMAQILLEKGYCDVVLLDVIEGIPQGKALDLAHAAPLVGSDGHVIGTNAWEDTAGSDVVVITGRPTGAKGSEFADYLLETLDDPRLEARWQGHQPHAKASAV